MEGDVRTAAGQRGESKTAQQRGALRTAAGERGCESAVLGQSRRVTCLTLMSC